METRVRSSRRRGAYTLSIKVVQSIEVIQANKKNITASRFIYFPGAITDIVARSPGKFDCAPEVSTRTIFRRENVVTKRKVLTYPVLGITSQQSVHVRVAKFYRRTSPNCMANMYLKQLKKLLVNNYRSFSDFSDHLPDIQVMYT